MRWRVIKVEFKKRIKKLLHSRFWIKLRFSVGQEVSSTVLLRSHWLQENSLACRNFRPPVLITIIWSPKNVSPKNDQLIQTYFPQALHSAFFFFLGEKNGWNYKGWKSILCPLNFAQFFIDLLQDFVAWKVLPQSVMIQCMRRHSKTPIHTQVFVKILLKATLISKVNYDNALFIITKLTTYRSAFCGGQEDMRSIVQFLLLRATLELWRIVWLNNGLWYVV